MNPSHHASHDVGTAHNVHRRSYTLALHIDPPRDIDIPLSGYIRTPHSYPAHSGMDAAFTSCSSNALVSTYPPHTRSAERIADVLEPVLLFLELPKRTHGR